MQDKLNLNRIVSDAAINWTIDKDRSHIIRDKSSDGVICVLVDYPLLRDEYGEMIQKSPTYLNENLKMKELLGSILEENDINRIKDLVNETLKSLNKEKK